MKYLDEIEKESFFTEAVENEEINGSRRCLTEVLLLVRRIFEMRPKVLVVLLVYYEKYSILSFKKMYNFVYYGAFAFSKVKPI